MSTEENLAKLERAVRAAFPSIPWRIDPRGAFGELEHVEFTITSPSRRGMVIPINVIESMSEEELQAALLTSETKFQAGRS